MRNTSLIEVEVWTLAKTDRGSAVLLRPLDSHRVVPIFIGQLEAQSILIGMGKVPMPRPLTHDLMLTMFEKLHLAIDRVDINDMQDDIYYAQLTARQGMKKYVFDSRPSDAISLAVRVNCPVYIAEFIVDETSIPETMVNPVPDISPEELEQAIEEELESGPETLGEESGKEPVARAPEEPGSALDQMIARLEIKLDAAVTQENYEEAARIRDEIQDMQTLQDGEAD